MVEPPLNLTTDESISDEQLPLGINFTEQEYVPPNGGYGWVCVACVFLINTHTWGLSFVIFLGLSTGNLSFSLHWLKDLGYRRTESS